MLATRFFLNGIDLAKPIFANTRHLAYGARSAATPSAFALWCGVKVSSDPDLAKAFEKDCEACFEAYTEFINRDWPT